MINIPTRDQITDLLVENSIGCELGVFEGDFADKLLKSNKFKELYLVDIFSGQTYNFEKYCPDASILQDKVTNRFINDDRITVIKSDSVSFLKSTNLLFDFIYIDTLHYYNHCIQELELSNKKIKNGGYICGHDYCSTFHGVIDAVQEFTKRYGYSLTITSEKDFPSFIIKVI
jgi:spermidine synthase